MGAISVFGVLSLIHTVPVTRKYLACHLIYWTLENANNRKCANKVFLSQEYWPLESISNFYFEEILIWRKKIHRNRLAPSLFRPCFYFHHKFSWHIALWRCSTHWMTHSTCRCTTATASPVLTQLMLYFVLGENTGVAYKLHSMSTSLSHLSRNGL